MKKYWGKGIATECAAAVTDYGFKVLKQEKLFAYTDCDNSVSQHILLKTGFQKQNSFEHEGDLCDWFVATSR